MKDQSIIENRSASNFKVKEKESFLFLRPLQVMKVVIVILQLMLSMNIQAANVVVDKTDDGILVPGCTLREAVDTINDQSGLCSHTGVFGQNDEITFSLPVDSAGRLLPVELLFGQLVIKRDLIINGGIGSLGPNEDPTIVDIYPRNNNDRIFSLTEPGIKILLNNLRLSEGSAVDGGAIYASNTDLTLEDVIVLNNAATGSGGGVYASNSAITLRRSSIQGNIAGANGGGLAFFGEPTSIDIYQSSVNGNTALVTGGGLYLNDVSQRASIVRKKIIKSTIANNEANQGGGLFLTEGSNLDIDTSTISNNSALSGFGGGLLTIQSSEVNILSSTVSNNTAANNAGIFIVGVGSKGLLFESIVANSEGGGADCGILAGGAIEIGNSSVNLIEDGSCATNAITGDPKLASLKINGGLTQTHALLEGSIAIDAGGRDGNFGQICTYTDLIAGIQPIDQRGEPRVSGGKCDLGAFEYQEPSSFFIIPTKNGGAAIIHL